LSHANESGAFGELFELAGTHVGAGRAETAQDVLDEGREGGREGGRKDGWKREGYEDLHLKEEIDDIKS